MEKRISLKKEKKQIHFLDIYEAFDHRPKLWIINLIFFLIILTITLFFALDLKLFDPSQGIIQWPTFSSMIKGFVSPNYNYLFGLGTYDFSSSVIYQVLQTFAIAFIGTIISSIIAIPFGFLASRKLFKRWSFISEIILITIRTFPEILLGFIMIKFSGFGALTGVFVISIHSIGMIGKLYSEQIDALDMTPLEALDACGSSSISRIRLGVVPQVAPGFISTILYRFDLNIKTASILGLVGAGGIGYPIGVYSVGFNWPELGACLWGIIVLVIIVDLISSSLRKKLV